MEQGGQLVAWVMTTQGPSKANEGGRVQVYGSTCGKVRGVLVGRTTSGHKLTC
jgi:hypothetical protein